MSGFKLLQMTVAHTDTHSTVQTIPMQFCFSYHQTCFKNFILYLFDYLTVIFSFLFSVIVSFKVISVQMYAYEIMKWKILTKAYV